MPRAWFGLIVLWVAVVAGCDRAPPDRPAVPETPPPLAKADITGIDEPAALVIAMKERVAADERDDQMALARFAPVDARLLLTDPAQLIPEDMRPTDAQAGPDFRQSNKEFVEQEVPADIRDAIGAEGHVRVLLVETCEADVGDALGIPGDYDEGSAAQYLDQARFEVAMEHEGLMPFALPGDFRDMEGDRDSIAALNARLFQLHRSGASKDILVVLDLSDGCGGGDLPVKLITNPPFKNLRILPAFYFDVCTRRGGDAWSPEHCRWWEDATREVTMVEGTYYYVATWKTGPEKRGTFAVDERAADAIDDGQATLTLDIKQ